MKSPEVIFLLPPHGILELNQISGSLAANHQPAELSHQPRLSILNTFVFINYVEAINIKSPCG